MTMGSSDDDQDVEFRKQLKAAVHYTVGKICQESERDLGIKYQRKFIAGLSEVTCKQIASFATDLELFSRHARRSTVFPEDVKLLVRKSPYLHKHIESLQTQIEADRDETKSKRNKKGKKKKTNPEGVDEDSNMAD